MTKQVAFIDTSGVRSLARPHKGQRGDALLEAMFAIVLASVIGLGLTYAAARTLNSQRYANAQGLMLNQMRGTLATSAGLAAMCETSVFGKVASQSVEMKVKSCETPELTVSAGDPDLPALDNVSVNGVVTRMTFATADSDDATRALIGDGAIEVKLE